MNKVKFKITIFLWLQTSSTSNLFQKGGLRLKKSITALGKFSSENKLILLTTFGSDVWKNLLPSAWLNMEV